jgi:acyl transferase domain-containing protein/NAD(P)-dependent dehydrogenase (short-subunit alcohol dehydrogenase family)
LAIVGIACRFPGAHNLNQFWDLVQKGACAIEELPADRLDRSLYYNPVKGSEGKTYTTLGGVIAAPQFDSKLCLEPDAYDIAHLMMLDVAAGACRDAGWDPLSMPLRNAGVYIGHARTGPLPAEVILSTHVEDIIRCLDQAPAFKRLPDPLRQAVREEIVHRVRSRKAHFREMGERFVNPGIAATLVSKALGLTGPHMVIDAACASSLVALALASGPLQDGRIDFAIVGGASYSNWQSLALFSRAQALSASGSYPFDSRADGFISSDGYAAIIVKTLDRAVADGDCIRAVIRGIGLSSDGRGKSLWAPRKEGQIEAIRRAYSNGVDPSRLQYIEAHGTSTQLGDATELQSLTEVLGPSIPSGCRIPIASVKGNIGHTCETAGLAGLIKTVLAMQHGIIPPAAGFEQPSPEINLDKVPFIIPAKPLEWPAAGDDYLRRAAVDAFGIGGLNVHLVVDQSAPSSIRGTLIPNNANPPEDREIAIIGAGAIFPGAHTAAAFWEMLAAGRDPKTKVTEDRWDPEVYWNPDRVGPWRSPSQVGGFITGFKLDPLKFRIPPKQMETSDPLQYMVLDAADQALRDAGYDVKPFDRRRVAVIVGTMFCGDFMRNLSVVLQYPELEKELTQLLTEKQVAEDAIRDILAGARKIFHRHKPMLKDETGSFSASTLASRIARTMDLMGGAFSLDAEEASSGAALDAAASLLRSGACDMVLCAGAQRSMDVGIYEEYAMRGLLSADGRGFLPAEGTGMLLLKRASDARKDADPIRGIIREIRSGIGNSESVPDPVAKLMGHTLGASGMASVLAAIAPDAAESSTVTNASPRGLSYEIEIDKRSSARHNRVAFLFPGQGSQYTGMLRDLVKESPAAAAKLQEADAIMKRLGYQSFSEIAWTAGSGLGTEPWQTQISMLLADVIVLAALEDLGLRPDVVAGHSYGEFPALVAAGSLTLEQAIRATRIRVDLVQSSAGGSCRLMATNAPANSAGRIIRDSGLAVHVAVLNAADQTILGGSSGNVERIVAILKAEGFYCTPLPLPGAFHTPLFADMREPFLSALAAIPILPPRVPMLSSVTVRYVAEPSEIRENLAAQTSVPLNYPEIAQRLAADGATILLEVGPQQVLTRLNQRILGGRTIMIACDNHKKPGMAQLAQVKTMLESKGVVFAASGNQGAAVDSRPVQKHEILYFDATQRRRERNLHRADSPDSKVEEAPLPDSLPPGETDWSSYLIQFVCEQTGYAREVVDLDADLESDLGIDSIKKMQLFSELRERFDFRGLQPSALAGFSTLRHVLNFLQDSAKTKESDGALFSSAAGANNGAAMKIFKLEGSPYAMGREHGRRQAEEIKALALKFNEALGGKAFERQDLKIVMSNLGDYFSKSSLEELRGLSEGAGLPLEILAGLNLALVPELISGCSHVAFAPPADEPGEILHGTNEDSPLLLTLGRMLAPSVLVRRPVDGIPHLTFVLPGQFAGINGINARGVAVSSALLLDRLPTDALPSGRTHSDLVKEILESAEDVESAVAIVRGARRLGGWGLLISHQARQKLCYLEYDEDTVSMDSHSSQIVGTNHSLLGDPGNGNRVPEHSINRRNRLEKLVKPNGNTSCSMDAMQTALRDCHDPVRDCRAERPTMSTVRRMDNLMSVVMRPRQNEVWVAAGLQAETYQRLDLNELFNPHRMRRWVLRAVEVPIPQSGPAHFSGASLVVGSNPAAAALQKRLFDLSPAGVDCIASPGQAEAVIRQAGESTPLRQLFLLSGLDPLVPDMGSIHQLCQAWVEHLRKANVLSEATLVAATNLGGDFGLSCHIGNAEGGGFAGLLKAIRREFPGIRIKILDVPREESPERLASEIVQELGSASREAEIGYCLGKRFAVRALQRSAKPRTPVRITPGGSWIVTGGSRGITALAARALAEKFGLKQHVLGRSASANLDYPAEYHCCDVSDAAALQSTIEGIRQVSGPIRGILHGAGVETAARFERKEIENVHATIASKAYGALRLMQLTRKDPLEAFLAFGSISGRFGGYGQSDYSLSSDMLAKLIQRFRAERPGCASIAFHWPAWDEIGMAMRPESRSALELAGQRFMPPEEGLDHLFAELNAGAPEGEILILDEPGSLDLDGCMLPVPETEQKPLVEGSLMQEPAHKISEIRFDPVDDPFLREHCYQGVPLLPAAAGIESLAECVDLPSGKLCLTLRDVEIINGLRFPESRPVWVRVTADADGTGAQCRLICAFRNREGKLVDPERVLISGRVQFEEAVLPPIMQEKAGGTWYPVQYPKQGPLIHGPSFQCLKEIVLDREKAFGRVLAQAPERVGGDRRGAWRIPIAELDACLVACGGYALKETGAVALPKKFDLLRIFRQPRAGEVCEAQIRHSGRSDSMMRFDFALYGADGAAILQAEGFSAAIVGQGSGL